MRAIERAEAATKTDEIRQTLARMDRWRKGAKADRVKRRRKLLGVELENKQTGETR